MLYPVPTVYTPSNEPSSTPTAAEAIPVLIKHRFPKTYRHAHLDVLLTRQRLSAEARALVRCGKAGVKVPGLRIADHREGVLGIEWIEGWSVREVLGGGQDDDQMADNEDDDGDDADTTGEDDAVGSDTQVRDRLRQMGIDDGQSSLCHLFSLLSSFQEQQELTTLLDDLIRCVARINRRRDSEDASCGCHSWRLDDFQHDGSAQERSHTIANV